ncbi:MAG: hypothetical protein LAO23_04545 [Acidobacteriia bacterium]|nr:hypothetical protein [Terriglobia bacterium]
MIFSEDREFKRDVAVKARERIKQQASRGVVAITVRALTRPVCEQRVRNLGARLRAEQVSTWVETVRKGKDGAYYGLRETLAQ